MAVSAKWIYTFDLEPSYIQYVMTQVLNNVRPSVCLVLLASLAPLFFFLYFSHTLVRSSSFHINMSDIKLEKLCYVVMLCSLTELLHQNLPVLSTQTILVVEEVV